MLHRKFATVTLNVRQSAARADRVAEGWTAPPNTMLVQARRKAAVIARTLPDAPPMVRLSVAEAARVLGVARATVFRWRIRFDADRRVTSLLPGCRGRRRGTSQINSKISDLIDAQIQAIICSLNVRAFAPWSSGFT